MQHVNRSKNKHHLSITIDAEKAFHHLGWNHVSQVQGAGQMYCGMGKSVKVRGWDTAQLQSKWGVSIHRSMVNSWSQGWTLTGPLVWGIYGLTMAKEMPKSPWEEQPEMDKASALPKPLPLCVFLQCGNWRRWVETKVKTLPWSMVKNFKKGFTGECGVKLTPNKIKVSLWSRLACSWWRVVPRRVTR
jgi:hypothetical protein